MTQTEVDNISRTIIGCAIEVHKELGVGLLESVYEKCIIHELKQKGLSIENQIKIPIDYKGVKLDAELRLDLLV